MTTPTPPEVGSLWEHENGEKRFVMKAEVSPLTGDIYPVLAAVLRPNGEHCVADFNFAKWRIWEQNARRIA